MPYYFIASQPRDAMLISLRYMAITLRYAVFAPCHTRLLLFADEHMLRRHYAMPRY